MLGNEGTDFAITSAIFLVFATGVVITLEGIIGHDLDFFIDVWGKRSNRWDPDRDRPWHPPDRHRRLGVGVGITLMAVAVLLALLVV
ncbi:MAG TPA: hypothetical protein VES40_04930 [Ilumatobacteraceae bacterium]|nr:hypothetical protein [Ilumatobacteraceae bacterium]